MHYQVNYLQPAFTPHYVRPYGQPIDTFGADVSPQDQTCITTAEYRDPNLYKWDPVSCRWIIRGNVWTGGIEGPKTTVSDAQARLVAYEDPYVRELEKLEADPQYQDAESQALIKNEISAAINETAAAIKAGMKTRTAGESLSLIERVTALLSAGKSGGTVTPQATTKPDNTPVILAGAGALALLAIIALR